VEAEMHYQGQRHPITVPLELPLLAEEIEAAFRSAYLHRYGNALTGAAVVVQVVTRVIGRRPRRLSDIAGVEASTWQSAIDHERPVHFGDRWIETPVLVRHLLDPGMQGVGPAVIEQPDTTTIIPPGISGRVDGFGNVIMEVI
jgi:N-methylhydantoinase A